MKKLFSFMLILFTLSLLTFNCGDDSGGNTTGSDKSSASNESESQSISSASSSESEASFDYAYCIFKDSTLQIALSSENMVSLTTSLDNSLPLTVKNNVLYSIDPNETTLFKLDPNAGSLKKATSFSLDSNNTDIVIGENRGYILNASSNTITIFRPKEMTLVNIITPESPYKGEVYKNKLFLLRKDSKKITLFNTDSSQITDTLTLDTKPLNPEIYTPKAGKNIYITSSDSQTSEIFSLNPETKNITKVKSVSGYVTELEFDEQGNLFYLENNKDNSLSRIMKKGNNTPIYTSNTSTITHFTITSSRLYFTYRKDGSTKLDLIIRNVEESGYQPIELGDDKILKLVKN